MSSSPTSHFRLCNNHMKPKTSHSDIDKIFIQNGQSRNYTNQKTNGAFFKKTTIALVASRVAWSKLRFEYKLPKLLIINIFDLIQPLRPCILLIHHLPPLPQLIPHQPKTKMETTSNFPLGKNKTPPIHTIKLIQKP